MKDAVNALFGGLSRGHEFASPLWLLALPLALLPQWPRRRHTLDHACIDWLPRDALGDALLRGGRIAAAIAMLAAIVGVAGIGQPATELQRTGRGAEIAIVLDRSRSMDEPLVPKGRQPVVDSTYESKGKVARRLLSDFAQRRPEDRYALLLFSSTPMAVVSFTQHGEVVQAAIEAGGIGRGLSETDIGRALLAGAEQFERRAYSGSRILLLVSDGAAQVDPDMRERLATLNRELPEKPFQGLVVLSPYLPDLDLEDATELRAYGEFLLHDLVPKAQASAPVFTSAACLGIDGVSLGGGAALRIGFMFPEAFGAVGSLQAAVGPQQIPGLVQKAQAARGKNPKFALRLLTSDDDYFREALAGYDKALSAAKVAHEFVQVPGPHDYAFNRGPGAFEMLLWHDRLLARS
jgi:hypothetical protein